MEIINKVRKFIKGIYVYINYKKKIDLSIKYDLYSELKNKELLLNKTSLISMTDKYGNITYVNDLFCNVSGYSFDELMNNNHRIINSGLHKNEFWKEMYKKTVIDKEIWHNLVINKKKSGDLYYVDSWIKAKFDEHGDHCGFISIRHDFTNLIENQMELYKKNCYLEYASKIIRHDMHSGINTYMPRGLKSLKRRLDDDTIEKLQLSYPIKMLDGGLEQTRFIYKGVYEFTNLVKENSNLSKEYIDLKMILIKFLKKTTYSDNVNIKDLPFYEVNQSLFCTAIDNLIRNGLKYNDSKNKRVEIFYNETTNDLFIEDNGRGMSNDDLNILRKPYIRNSRNKSDEDGSGLGLNISIFILEEHGFNVSCEKIQEPNTGTRFKIHLG